ncbi:MAG: DUF697 domain-containing protein [Acholeplasmataceae bacterium]
MKKDSTKLFWYLIAIGLFIIFALMLTSSILNVGDRLTKIHPYVEYGFYGLVFLLVYFLILRPLQIILFSPAFSVETTLNKKPRKNFPLYKKVAKRLISQEDFSDEQKQKLKDSMKNPDELQASLEHAFNHHVKKKINKIIRKHAKTVMISTAISQNGRLDFITVFVVNLNMIKELVVTCGFRPSMKNLSKLTVNVFTTALIAEGLESININDVLPQSTMNALADVPLIRPILSSIMQGISNALLTLRIGIVTRKFLFSDAKEITKSEIRRGALLEAAKMLPVVVAEGLAMFPQKIFKLFKKKPATDENDTTQS